MLPRVKGAAAAAPSSSSRQSGGRARPDARHEAESRTNNKAALAEAYQQFLTTLRQMAADDESDNENRPTTTGSSSAAVSSGTLTHRGDSAAPPPPPNQAEAGRSAKPGLKALAQQPLPLLRVSHIDLRTKEHKTINIPGQRAGTLLLMFRHFARIGRDAGDAKKVSKKARPKKMVRCLMQ